MCQLITNKINLIYLKSNLCTFFIFYQSSINFLKPWKNRKNGDFYKSFDWLKIEIVKKKFNISVNECKINN